MLSPPTHVSSDEVAGKNNDDEATKDGPDNDGNDVVLLGWVRRRAVAGSRAERRQREVGGC